MVSAVTQSLDLVTSAVTARMLSREGWWLQPGRCAYYKLRLLFSALWPGTCGAWIGLSASAATAVWP
eukprot:6212871-Pleurochrysis_carterae.AAC.1